MATPMGLEPTISRVTVWRDNHYTTESYVGYAHTVSFHWLAVITNNPHSTLHLTLFANRGKCFIMLRPLASYQSVDYYYVVNRLKLANCPATLKWPRRIL